MSVIQLDPMISWECKGELNFLARLCEICDTLLASFAGLGKRNGRIYWYLFES